VVVTIFDLMKVKDLKDLRIYISMILAVFMSLIIGMIFEYRPPVINSKILINFSLVFSALCYATLFFIWKKIDRLQKFYEPKPYQHLGKIKVSESDFEDPENPTKEEMENFIQSLDLSKYEDKIYISPQFLKVYVIPFFLLSLLGTIVSIIYAETLDLDGFLIMLAIILIPYIGGWLMYTYGLIKYDLIPLKI